jgi:hypothetical protein
MASLGPAENKENTEIGSPQLAGPGSLQDAFKRYRTMRVKANTLASRGRPVRDSAFKTALRAKFIETLKRYIGVVRWFVEGKVLQAAGFWKPTAVGNVSSAFRPRIWGVEMDVYPCNANWFQQPSTWLCLARFSSGSRSVNVRCENTPCARGGFGAVRIFFSNTCRLSRVSYHSGAGFAAATIPSFLFFRTSIFRISRVFVRVYAALQCLARSLCILLFRLLWIGTASDG